ncbi:MAG: 3-methyl-2-oxobutanoate dehydrogenase subunit VorB, partial [Candidatus Omnitrophota bacterium]
SKRMDEVGGVFIQAESELAAINMVFGAAAAGKRAMTSSSSPGISLKQEGISYIAGCELPAVIVNVMRGGPGLGNIGPGQADYFQATKGGGHGDYHNVVLAPASSQEMFELTKRAFEIADKYRGPVMILADGILGQMMEPIEISLPKNGRRDHVSSEYCRKEKAKTWALTGARGRKPNVIKSLYLKEGELEGLNDRFQKKYEVIKKYETKFENYKTKDADIIIVAYGTSSRISKACVDRLRNNNIKAGLFRPISLWPFPYKELKMLDKGKTKFLAVEMSAGQMVEDVRLAVENDKRVSFYGRTGGGVPTEEAIIKMVSKQKR